MTPSEMDARTAHAPTAWILRMMDWDASWLGLGWLRPTAKTEPMSFWSTAIIVLITSTAFPLLAALVYLSALVSHDRALEFGVYLAVIGVPVNALLQFLGAAVWNQRAAQLRGSP